MLYDDFDIQCKETRVLPTGGEGNIVCSKQGYLKEIAFRRERNKELSKDCQFKIPKWEDLRVYDKED